MSSTIFFFFFIPLLSFILLAVNIIFAPRNSYMEKNSAFECGFSSFLGQNRTQFSISFFIFALLFLLFDLEILLVYPYLVSAYLNEVYGLLVLMAFLGALTIGFVFELGKKALTIDSRQTSHSYKKIMPPRKLSRSSIILSDKSDESHVRLTDNKVAVQSSLNVNAVTLFTASKRISLPTPSVLNNCQKRQLSTTRPLQGLTLGKKHSQVKAQIEDYQTQILNYPPEHTKKWVDLLTMNEKILRSNKLNNNHMERLRRTDIWHDFIATQNHTKPNKWSPNMAINSNRNAEIGRERTTLRPIYMEPETNTQLDKVKQTKMLNRDVNGNTIADPLRPVHVPFKPEAMDQSALDRLNSKIRVDSMIKDDSITELIFLPFIPLSELSPWLRFIGIVISWMRIMKIGTRVRIHFLPLQLIKLHEMRPFVTVKVFIIITVALDRFKVFRNTTITYINSLRFGYPKPHKDVIMDYYMDYADNLVIIQS